jgi:hypothetical protein
VQVVVLHVLDDVGKVVLRREPAADAVVGAKVALDLEAVRRRRVPLKRKIFDIDWERVWRLRNTTGDYQKICHKFFHGQWQGKVCTKWTIAV